MKKLWKLFFMLILLSASTSFASNASKLRPFELWKKKFIEKYSKKGLPKKFLIKHLKKLGTSLQ